MTVEEFTYNPHAPEVMENPVDHYRVLRDRFPVYYIEEYDAYAISRFEDVMAVLADRDSFTAVEGTVMPPERFLQSNQGVLPSWSRDPLPSSTMTDTPIYEEIRQAQIAPLRPNRVKGLEQLVRSLVRARLDELLPRGRFDLTTEYGGIVAASTMCHLYGLPLTMAEDVLSIVNLGSAFAEDEEGEVSAPSAEKALEHTREILLRAIRPRRAAGADGRFPLIDGLIDYRLDGRALTDDEICDQLACVLVGGTETLPKVVAHGLWELARHPDQLAEIRADLPTNCAIAFKEMTRCCGPAQWFSRTVARPVTIAGQELEVGRRVILLIQSAGHDPREFDDPDEFIWNRPIERNLAFGFGQHFCIGIHVANLEGRILLEEFLARVSAYEIDEANAVRPPSSFQWGWATLPVIINETQGE